MTFLGAVGDVPADAELTHRALAAVIEGTTDYVFVKDLDGRIIAVNASGAKAVGWSREELIGRTIQEVSPGPLADAMAETDRLMLERGTVETFEESGPLGDETRVFLSTKGPYRARDGTQLATFWIAHDITARKAREQELVQSEERLRLAQEGARIAPGTSTSSPASPRGRPAFECCTASTRRLRLGVVENLADLGREIPDDWFHEEPFEGCLFMNTLTEAHRQPTPIRNVAVEALAEIRAVVADVAAAAGVRDPKTFADRLQILMSGSITAALHGDAQAAKHARSLAEPFLQRELPDE